MSMQASGSYVVFIILILICGSVVLLNLWGYNRQKDKDDKDTEKLKNSIVESMKENNADLINSLKEVMIENNKALLEPINRIVEQNNRILERLEAQNGKCKAST